MGFRSKPNQELARAAVDKGEAIQISQIGINQEPQVVISVFHTCQIYLP